MLNPVMLDKVKFFDDFIESEKAEIAQGDHSVFKKYHELQPILNEGEEGNSFFILIQGLANVYKKPNVNAIAELKAGAVFGELAFLSRRLRVASVVAMQSCVVLEFSHAMLGKLSPDLRDKLKDKLISLLVHHLDDIIKLRTKIYFNQNPTPWVAPKINEEPNKKIEIFNDKDYQIYYLGNLEAILENSVEGTQRKVRMAELTDEIPLKFLRIIKKGRQDPDDYLFGQDGSQLGYVIPKKARQVWQSTMVSYHSDVLLRRRQLELYQRVDQIY